MIKEFRLPDRAALQPQRDRTFPGPHEVGEGLFTMAQRRREQMDVVGHQAELGDFPSLSPRTAPQAFDGHADGVGCEEQALAVVTTGSDEIDHRLVERQPNRDA